MVVYYIKYVLVDIERGQSTKPEEELLFSLSVYLLTSSLVYINNKGSNNIFSSYFSFL